MDTDIHTDMAELLVAVEPAGIHKPAAVDMDMDIRKVLAVGTAVSSGSAG